MFPSPDGDFLVSFLFALIVFQSAHILLLCWHFSSLCLYFIFPFLCICLLVPLILILLFYIYFPRSSLLDDLVLLIDILHFFCVLLHYFLFFCSFTFEMEPYLKISTLYPCFNLFVTSHAVFTFYVLLPFLDIMIFCFVFIIV